MNTEKNNEFKNKSNETFEKCSQRVSTILKDTNWSVEYVYPTYKGVILRICLNGKRNTELDLVWKEQTKYESESFTTNVRTAGSFDLFSGNEPGTEANFYKEVGMLISNIEVLSKIKEAAKDCSAEMETLEREYTELQDKD